MEKRNPLMALLVRELIPAAVIVAVAMIGQRLTHHLFSGTK